MPLKLDLRHCEKRSDEATQTSVAAFLGCFGFASQ
jgi:hypothetical protein